MSLVNLGLNSLYVEKLALKADVHPQRLCLNCYPRVAVHDVLACVYRAKLLPHYSVGGTLCML